MGITTTGVNRDMYARVHVSSDPRPSRFSNEGRDYQGWASRADQWARQQAAMSALAGLQESADNGGWES